MFKILKKTSVFILCMAIFFNIVTTTSFAESTNDRFRGVWISTVYNIDYPKTKTTNPEILKKEATEILDNCKSMGFNAVIFQVRPTGDAFYKSSIFPWSKSISGTEGIAPENNFDPLEYWVLEAHKRGLELHAWVNPYRITNNSKADNWALMASNNPAKLHPEYTVKHTDGNYYFDPAIPEARQLIINGALEIVKNYDVDGIHIDDYFYPDKNFNDDASFKKYGSSFSSKDDWRRNNVNYFIKEMQRQIHEVKNDVVFGVSPAGIWANKSSNPLGSDTAGSETYYKLFADTKRWAEEGWIDYIAPQIYWYIGQKGSDYQILVNWWSNVVKNSKTKLYIGLAGYKCADSTFASTPFNNADDIPRQLELNKNTDNVDGEILFTYSSTYKLPALKQKITQYYSTNQTNSNNNANISQDIKVIIDNKELDFGNDQKPIIENSRTLVPMRAIFEALGAEVEWIKDTEEIVATCNNKKIIMQIGNSQMSIEGEAPRTLDVKPKIKGGRTLVPLRAISEVFGGEVNWDNDTRTITITTEINKNSCITGDSSYTVFFYSVIIVILLFIIFCIFRFIFIKLNK